MAGAIPAIMSMIGGAGATASGIGGLLGSGGGVAGQGLSLLGSSDILGDVVDNYMSNSAAEVKSEGGEEGLSHMDKYLERAFASGNLGRKSENPTPFGTGSPFAQAKPTNSLGPLQSLMGMTNMNPGSNRDNRREKMQKPSADEYIRSLLGG